MKRLCLTIVLLCGMQGGARQAHADETDNFTCRAVPLRDSLDALDALMNGDIRQVLDAVNQLGPATCGVDCLRLALQETIGASDRHPLTGIPHARFSRRIDQRRDIDRCHLPFTASIYGARPYNQPWLFPFTGRIIFVADSINLSGHVVGLDKINHFLREGLAHRRDVERGGSIGLVMARELGAPGQPPRMNERGLKGLALTGVLAYADLAASYAGYRFWTDLLTVGGPASLLTYDEDARRFVPRRPFTFAAYVNDAWDEAINCSAFSPALSRQVAAALEDRSMGCPARSCGHLAALPNAALYVNAACLAAPTGTPARRQTSSSFRRRS